MNDPTLDESVSRDYIIYLCPVGELQIALLHFWKRSLADCGWNRAHNIFPHVTLCSFFKVNQCVVICDQFSTAFLQNLEKYVLNMLAPRKADDAVLRLTGKGHQQRSSWNIKNGEIIQVCKMSTAIWNIIQNVEISFVTSSNIIQDGEISFVIYSSLKIVK